MLLNPFKNIAFSENWFKQFNYLFTFLLNNSKTGLYLRSKLRLTDFDITIPIVKLTPSTVHYEVDRGTFQIVAYSYNRIANLLKLEFENIFMFLHKFDMNIANKFLPVLNLGYDTLTTYSLASDGEIHINSAATWTDARVALTGSIGSTTSATNTVTRTSLNGGLYFCYRGFFYFTTSSLTSLATIVDATFSLYGSSVVGTPSISIQLGTQGTTLNASDYDAFSGTYYNFSTTWTNAVYNNFTLNAQGLTDISKTSITKYCVRDYTYDYLNVAPTGDNGIIAYMANQTGTTQDPKLVVTYTMPASSANAYIY